MTATAGAGTSASLCQMARTLFANPLGTARRGQCKPPRPLDTRSADLTQILDEPLEEQEVDQVA